MSIVVDAFMKKERLFHNLAAVTVYITQSPLNFPQVLVKTESSWLDDRKALKILKRQRSEL